MFKQNFVPVYVVDVEIFQGISEKSGDHQREWVSFLRDHEFDSVWGKTVTLVSVQ